MDALLDEIRRRGVNQPLALDPAAPGEAGGDQLDPEMGFAALAPARVAMMARRFATR